MGHPLKIFEGSRCKNLRKEESDKTLKRAQSKISNGNDHGDQERIKCLRALLAIVVIEGATSQKAERKIAK